MIHIEEPSLQTETARVEQRIAQGARFVPLFRVIELPKGAEALDLLDAFPGAACFQRSAGAEDRTELTETVIGLESFESLQARGGHVTLQTAQGREDREGDPFGILAERMQHHHAIPEAGLPYFQGGAIGYFSYDSVRFLEPRLAGTPGNLKELSSCADGPCDAEFRFYRKAIVVDHVRGRIALVSGIQVGVGPLEAAIQRARAELHELQAVCRSIPSPKPVPVPSPADCPELPTEEMAPMLGRKAFLQGVRKLKEHIREGDIFQAVLSERFTTPFEGSPLGLFRILCRLSPSPYQFHLPFEGRVFLGASPEMLLRVNGGELESHPIAGTRPRGRDADEERRLESQLLRSTKEKAEHLMLVDLARNDIGRVSQAGSVRVRSFMKLKKFSAVMHLVSRVTGQVQPEAAPVAALASCFPAGTLSGAPKIRAMELISGLETRPRGFYGGAVVAASFSGDLDSCISIRSIELGQGLATIQAGAGIVADSRPEKEYEEVQHKTRAARRALAVALGRGVPSPACRACQDEELEAVGPALVAQGGA